MASVVGTCVLLLTIISVSAALNVNLDCTSENHVQYGLDSILKCDINPTKEATDAMIKVVTWKKVGSEKPLVVFRKDLQPTNEPRFRFSVENLTGTSRNVSLTVSNTQINDSGEYECMVMTNSGSPVKVKINLIVTAKYSEPKVSSKPEDDTLICNSEGGYPKGTIRWLDQDKKELTSSSQEPPEQMDDKLRFKLTSTLKNPASSQYTCSVYNANGDKEGETPFDHTSKRESSVSDRPGGNDAATKIVAPVVVIGSLIVGLLVVLLLKRRRSNGPQTTHTPVYQDEEKANCLDGEGAERGKKCDHSGEMNAVDEEGLQVMIPLSEL